jgi:predicted GTPase
MNDAIIRLYDTPGLCDSADMSNDDAYIAAIKEVLPSIDLVLFATPLNETRVSRDERIALRSLSAAVGKELWENMIVIFSFACSPLPGQAQFDSFLNDRAKAFKEFVAQIASVNIATGLPFLAVDNKSKLTPDGREWVPELFTLVIERCSAYGVMPFVEALGAEVGSTENPADSNKKNEDHASSQTETRRIGLNQDQKQRVTRGLKRSVIGGAIIGAVAAVAAVPGGVVVGAPLLFLGGAAGAAIGFWRWISKK